VSTLNFFLYCRGVGADFPQFILIWVQKYFLLNDDWSLSLGPNVERIRNRANLLIADINLPAIQEIPLVIDCDLLLEILVNNIRNDLVSFQSYLCKKQKKDILDLLTELNLRKEEGNLKEVLHLEKSLSDIVDKKAKIEFEKLKNFEVLHMEKITPFSTFLNWLNRVNLKVSFVTFETWLKYHLPQNLNKKTSLSTIMPMSLKYRKIGLKFSQGILKSFSGMNY